MRPLVRKPLKPTKPPTIQEQWRRATLVEKAQVVSAFVTVFTLAVVAFQVVDNHRLTDITERQMLIASQQMGLSFAPNVRAVSVVLTENSPQAGSPFGAAIVYKNIGTSRADNVHAVAYAHTLGRTSSVDDEKDLLVQGESGTIDFPSVLWAPNTDFQVIVRISYRGSTDDGGTSSQRESCTAFKYNEPTKSFMQETACSK